MAFSEDRISHLSHEILERLWRDDLADIGDESRALAVVKQSLERFFAIADQVDDSVRAKLKNRAQGSKDWELLYTKFFQEELVKRGL